MHPLRHLRTINEHRKLVRKYCFRIGLYRQGLTHDLSKYSPAEFWRGAIFYTGTKSPVAAERRARGVSSAWLHHKGRNRHHPEHWIDYILNDDGSVSFGPNKMPKKYVAEMFCDSIAASKTYLGDGYTDSAPYDRFIREKKRKQIHPENSEDYEKMLRILRDEGEDAAISYIRNWLKK